MADKWEKIIIKRGKKQAYVLTPINNDDLYFTPELKLRKLLIEVSGHPTIGTGHPKPLSGDRTRQWSRRITEKHRLVCLINEEKKSVFVISVSGHCDDK